MHKAFSLPVMEFPLPEEVPTASEESSHCQKKRDAAAEKIALLLNSSSNCQSKSYDSYAKDSYEAPGNVASTGSTSDGTGKKKGRVVTLTTDDMQKRKNDVKERTTLLLSLPDEHQLRFSKYKTALELWAAILKTFGGNEATKKTKKNLLNQLQFMDVKIKQDDLNQKFLTSLAPEWLIHTIVWRNRSDLDTMSLDDLYNHLKVYESKVQKKSKPNSQNMAFISSAKHSSRNEEVNIASGSTASINVSTASANIGVASINQDTAYAYIASQSSGTKISIQRLDVAGFDKSNVECFNCHKMGHFARECRAPRSQERGRRDNYRQWNDEENHALIADEETPIEFSLMAKTSTESEVEARLAEHRNQEVRYCEKIRVLEFQTESRANCIESLTKELELIKKEKEGLESKLTGFQSASKDLDSLLERLPEFADDTVTDYSRPVPTIESSPDDAQNRNPSGTETEASPRKKEMLLRPQRVGFGRLDRIHLIKGSSQNNIDDKGYWDSGCSRHMTGNISYLSDYEPFDGGYLSFGQGGCNITIKGTIKTGKLEFENVYFVKDLKYNLFSVSQICDNKNSVLFTDSECIVLGRDFKLLDAANVLLRTPRQHNMRLGHLNFKTMNKLVRHNLVRGLPSKCFENDHTCTACLKGKQHRL
nr:hypothetical protein [Tanacetum cinerariifolium]